MVTGSGQADPARCVRNASSARDPNRMAAAHGRLVLERNLGDPCRQREHDVEVRHRQQLDHGVRRASHGRARATFVAVRRSQSRTCVGAAFQLDGAHHAPFDAAQVAVMCTAISGAVAAEDIRPFRPADMMPTAQPGGTTSASAGRGSRSAGSGVRAPAERRRSRAFCDPAPTWMMPISAPLSQDARCAKPCGPQRMHRHTLGQARCGTGRAAGGVQHLDVDGLGLVPTGEEPMLGAGQTPVGPQDPEPLRRQHDVAVLAALAVLHPDDHPAAVDITDLETSGLGRPRPAA